MSLSPQAIFSECLGCSEVEKCSSCLGKDEYRNYTAQAYESHRGISCKVCSNSFVCSNSVTCKDILCVSAFSKAFFLLWYLSEHFFFPSSFRWTKDGEEFDPGSDPELKVSERSGSSAFYTLSNTVETLKQYQGKYVCYASNELGTAVSNEAILNTDGKNTLMAD